MTTATLPPPEYLPLLTTHIRQAEGDDESTLARQWRLLKLLTFAPKGFTVKELAAVSGVCEKTVRRDLILLKHVGFDLTETVEDFGARPGAFAAFPNRRAERAGREKSIA